MFCIAVCAIVLQFDMQLKLWLCNALHLLLQHFVTELRFL